MFYALKAWSEYCKANGIKDPVRLRQEAVVKGTPKPAPADYKIFAARKDAFLAKWVYDNEGWEALARCKDKRVQEYAKIMMPCGGATGQCALECPVFNICEAKARERYDS